MASQGKRTPEKKGKSTALKRRPAAGTTSRARASNPATKQIDWRIEELGGWRGATLARIRSLVAAALPGVTEEVKWRGTPVWSCHGIICTGEAYKSVVKLTFAHGASLPDPKRLFNSCLEGNTRRAIDIREGETVNARAFIALVKAAAAWNEGRKASSAGPVSAGETPPKRKRQTKTASSARTAMSAKPRPLNRNSDGVVLLSGGNPQIAKADGDAPVQAYINAMPGWKSRVGREVDDLVNRHVPQVRKAVRWNSPFYGIEDRGWFLAVHCLTRYVKLTFFNGISLRPVPPGCTPKSGDSRWLDVYEADRIDQDLLAKWLKQAAALPGWNS